jgi:hypothetical protein
VHGVMRPVDGRRKRRLSDDEYAALGAAYAELWKRGYGLQRLQRRGFWR